MKFNFQVLVAFLIFIAAVATPQQAPNPPAAVLADPSIDKLNPPSLAILTIPSHEVDMDAFFYLAAGAGSHGTVVLVHGLPGYEINGDLAQSIRRAGWNVLLFHYRGTWGVSGRRAATISLIDRQSGPFHSAFCEIDHFSGRALGLLNET
jgi:hypothetical protein